MQFAPLSSVAEKIPTTKFVAGGGELPELPEVETVRRGLEQVMRGRIIQNAEIRGSGLRWPFPDNLKEQLTGSRVDNIDRLGKYLLFGLSTGTTLISHLGMSGRFAVHSARSPEPEGQVGGIGCGKHDHVLIRMCDGTAIIYNDPRRFGMMDLVATAEVGSHRSLAILGPEPLGNAFSESNLQRRLGTKSTPIKSALLDQQVVAGLGNIYVCEALWCSGISPFRPARSVVDDERSVLVSSIRKVLRDAIDAGGSTLRDHRQVGGELGYFQHRFNVYGRKGHPCPREACNGIVSRAVQAGRSTFHCECCQL